MAVKCPNCKNDLYSPFKYCDSCGWEAEGKDLKKAEKLAEKKRKKKEEELESKRKEMTEKYLERERKLGREIPENDKNRDFEDLDDDEFKDIFGDFDDDEDEDDYDEAPKKKGKSKKSEPEGVMIPCKCGNMIQVVSPKRPIKITCPKCGRGGTLKKDPPGAKPIKDVEEEEEEPPRKKSDSPPRKERDSPPQREKRERPKSSKPMPKKGRCSQCQSTKLQFRDDGRGRCRDCGHKFYWDKSMDPKNRKDGGGGGDRDRKRAPECPDCGQRAKWVKKYKRFYCKDCEQYVK